MPLKFILSPLSSPRRWESEFIQLEVWRFSLIPRPFSQVSQNRRWRLAHYFDWLHMIFRAAHNGDVPQSVYRTQRLIPVGHYELCRDDIGVLWKAPQAEPRHNLVACRCWQVSAWQTNAMQEVATFLPLQCKFTNLGAHRDHWVHRCCCACRWPSHCSFPHGIGRDFDLQWKTASGLSYFLLQLVVTAGKRAFHRRALRRPHPARREVTCGDTDMDWPRLGAVLHTTGLWGRSYLGVGRRAASRTWQKLCHREDTGLPWGKPYRGRIHIWDYPKGNQAIRTPSPVQGLTGDPGELTPVLGLASDCVPCRRPSSLPGWARDGAPGPPWWTSPSRGTAPWLSSLVERSQSPCAAPASTPGRYYPRAPVWAPWLGEPAG